MCDGIIGRTGTTYSTFRTDFNTRKVVAPKVTIDLSKSFYNPSTRKGYVTAHITNVSGSSLSGLLYIAITETNLSGYYDVLRDLLRAAGSPVSLAAGASLDSTKDFGISSGGGWNPSNCSIVAFIQNTSTGEIYQGAKISVTSIATEETSNKNTFTVKVSPNPFTSNTNVCYSIEKKEKVQVGIYDIAGKLVKQLVNSEQDAGTHTAYWDGKNDLGNKIGAGIYFCVVNSGNRKNVSKILAVR
ncbi:MAG: FlgD immunoglobulin-like domain containing protein [bacterium]|nr:FlgD immunoglobulin-like domain containing protein [bacterium]